MTEREVADAMPRYEGLVLSTARMLADGSHPSMQGRAAIEEECDDVAQLLRIKVLKALRKFDPTRVVGKHSRNVRGYTRLDMYVNMCVQDRAKDIAKRKRRCELHVEDFNSPRTRRDRDDDWFEHRYMSETSEQAFAEVEDELPVLPATLTERERRVMLLMYEDHRQTEIAKLLSISKREVETAVRQVRVKMAAWRPAASAA